MPTSFKLHHPDIHILEDFPNAKILFAARHPIANHEAIKRYTPPRLR